MCSSGPCIVSGLFFWVPFFSKTFLVGSKDTSNSVGPQSRHCRQSNCLLIKKKLTGHLADHSQNQKKDNQSNRGKPIQGINQKRSPKNREARNTRKKWNGMEVQTLSALVFGCIS